MRKSEICRLLSEKLEPNFTTVDGSYPRFWVSSCKGWQPADYFESEDASAKLLEAMPEVDLEHYQSGGLNEWGVLYSQAPDHTLHADRKTAIVLAACKWLGIEGEIGE